MSRATIHSEPFVKLTTENHCSYLLYQQTTDRNDRRAFTRLTEQDIRNKVTLLEYKVCRLKRH